jgi:hypothetical protein
MHEDTRRFSIGRVLSRGVATVVAQPVTTVGLAFLFGALPGALLNYGVTTVGEDAAGQLGGEATVVLGVFSGLVGIILSMIVQGALVRATTAYAHGHRARFADCALTGLRMVVPLFVLGIVVAFGLVLGFMFLVVPGIMLYLAWSVAAPVLVDERLGVFGALSRSRALTRGARWHIFALFLVMFVIYFAVSAAIAALGFLFFGVDDFSAGARAGTVLLPILVASTLTQTLVTVFWGTIQTSLYVELRDWQDGPPAEALAEIFA